jgi:hypothetical protein
MRSTTSGGVGTNGTSPSVQMAIGEQPLTIRRVKLNAHGSINFLTLGYNSLDPSERFYRSLTGERQSVSFDHRPLTMIAVYYVLGVGAFIIRRRKLWRLGMIF